MENYIQTDVKDGYPILTLTRPEARKALNTSLENPIINTLRHCGRLHPTDRYANCSSINAFAGGVFEAV